MALPPTTPCFVCGKEARIQELDVNSFVNCPRCGNYTVTRPAQFLGISKRRDAYKLSGVLRHASDSGKVVDIGTDNVEELIRNAPAPSDLVEYIDELLFHVTAHTKAMHEVVQLDPYNDYPVIYSQSAEEFMYIIEQGRQLGYFVRVTGNYDMLIDVKGWEQVRKLESTRTGIENLAFMAMPFGKSELDENYRHLVNAVQQSGFDLKRVDEGQKAGLIDDQLRVRIRASRFMLAELTYENQNVYWEAGYAEGIGRPVIYLCRVEPGANLRTHFDANHLTTVLWHESNRDEAMEKLKATIRATFPGEASQR